MTIRTMAGLGCILCWALWASTAAGAQAMLVKDSKPQAIIVIADAPLRKTRFAAQELQQYIHRISGAQLPILSSSEAASRADAVQVYVGRSAATDARQLSSDGLRYGAFRIVSGDRWLALLGDEGEFKPIEPWVAKRSAEERERVREAFDRISGEPFMSPYDQLYKFKDEELGVWVHDGAGPLNAVHEWLRSLGVRWFMPGEIGEVVPTLADIALPAIDRTWRPDFKLRSFRYFYDHLPVTKADRLWSLRLGLYEGHDLLGLTLPGHGSKFVYGRPEMKERHPEMFAIWGGKRAFEHRRGIGAPCLSSPELFEKHVRYARTLFDHYQEPLISLDVVDGYVFPCECEKCRGLATPGRNWNGTLSDYVWGYINRVARELYKSHPDRMVSGLAYSTYQLPPEKIDQLSPNLALIICQTRDTFISPDTRRRFVDLRKQWLAKLPSKKLFIWDYYLTNRPGKPYEGIPLYETRLIVDDLRSLKGLSQGDTIEVYRHPPEPEFPYDALATMHLNLYVTSRLWWDAEQDLNALLDDYYDKFYGPAAKQMKAFVEYSEANYSRMRSEPETVDQVMTLLQAARDAAGDADNIYRRRVDLLTAYMKPMNELRERLAKGRGDVPTFRALERNPRDLVIDGKLDDKFWNEVRTGVLVDLKTGYGSKQNPTSVRMAWAGDSLYLAVSCRDENIVSLNRAPLGNDDNGIFARDNVDILIETQTHQYYQIVVSPTGQVMDLDRARGLASEWSSNATVATHIDDQGWSAELRIPVAGESAEDLDPLVGLAGRKPSITYPWYVNVCRQIVRDGGTQHIVLHRSDKARFHDVSNFVKLYVK
jgi:hypothetical protein